MQRTFLRSLIVASTVLSLQLLHPASGFAQEYTQLQVLLPGESAAPGTGTGKLGTPDAQTVGIPFDIRVRACDDSWNTVTSISDVVELSSSDAGATLPGQTALSAGEVTLTVTVNAAGSFTFSADDLTDPTIPQATSAPFTALVVNGFEFSRINQKNQNAGQPMAITLSAVDPQGNVVSGFTGAVRLQQITSFGVGRIEPSIVTLSGGTWSGSVTMYRADETAINRGNVNIFAFLGVDQSKNGTSDPFTVHPGPFARVQIVVPGQDPLPGSVSGVTGSPATHGVGQTFEVDVFATDQYWNPVPSGDTVRITSSDNNASTPVTGAMNNGIGQFFVTLNTVGTQTLSITDQSNGSIRGMTTPGIQVIPAAVSQFLIDPIASPVTAGDPVSVTIRASDSGGNPLVDYNGDAILAANTGPGSISPEAIVFTNGVWSGAMVFRGAGGAVAFTCSDYSSPPNIGTSDNFTVLPGAFTGLQVLLPGETPAGGTDSGISGAPDDQNAGSSFNLQVRAVDDYWNRVPGIDARFALVSSDGFADMPSDTTLTNGELFLPITLFRAGSQTISVSAVDTSGVAGHTSSAVQVLSGPYARLLLLAPGEEMAPGTEEGRTGSATDQSINFAFTLRVYATDNWFNPVSGVTDVVAITSNDPLAQLPPDAAMVDGLADMVIRLSTGGFQQITASNVSNPGIPSSTTQVRAISSGFHLEAEVTPTTVQAGEPFTLTVAVTNDAGSVIQEINSSVEIEVQNASTQDPGAGTLSQTQFQLLQGQRSVALTYTFSEPIVLIIRDDAGNEPAVSEVITVLPGQPAALTLTSDPTWVGGNKHATVIATVLDAFDNGVPGQVVDFSIVSGDGELTPVDSLTDDGGVSRADFLSARSPQITVVRATSGALVTDYELETAFVDPTAPGGFVTNYPNPFHPGEAPTTIAYKLADNASVRIELYTLSGGLVLRQEFQAGEVGGRVGLNEYVWDGRNGDGDFVSSGGYLLVVEAEGAGETLHVMRRKIAVVR
ncbi:MAG: hypothetical protein JSW67_05940 [Candidatus Latescibacterota bacterium]|nr:MAG: hypothetical protein JSW67_05940 [Candidatus Latescibacterota bacterium]